VVKFLYIINILRLCFDDTRVFEVTSKEAIEENFGGGNYPSRSAIALFYIRDSEYNKLMTPVANMYEVIPSHCRAYFDLRISKKNGPIR